MAPIQDPSRADRLKTGISKVRWCDPDGGRYSFSPARVKKVMIDESATEMCWFDELFKGGILLPRGNKNERRAITLLITGPPGTGKSTLAMELCVRLALKSKSEVFGNKTPDLLGGKTLYVVSEAHPPWMIDNARSFGWLRDLDVQNLFELGPVHKQAPINVCTISDVEVGLGPTFDELREMLGLTLKGSGAKTPTSSNLGLVVIDSLNTVRTDKALAFEKLYKKFVESGPRMVVFVLDSSPNRPIAETWEFASDIVLRLDREYGSGYMIRTIEIVKARYQPHVWGKHQLKIYEAQKMEERPADVPPLEVQEQRLRAHPWSEGGIFVFPSIHYILSRYKRVAPFSFDEKTVSTPILSLNRLLGKGIPAGRTTALLGGRGTHKSHLGYLQALHNALANGKSLIISLRDDEAMTMETLDSILTQHWPTYRNTVDDLLKSGRLEIAYYMPGYVTPEEFFHRLLLSIYRMRGGDETCPITLLFNSLDQIASRFPLCAEERVFVPGIIQTLAAIGVTSVFVGADTEGIDEGLRNLLSMAELIIRVKRIDFPKGKFLEILCNASDDLIRQDGKEKAQELPDGFPATELTIERYAGGKPAGSQGLLELVTEESVLGCVLAPGLQFIPYRIAPAAHDNADGIPVKQ